MKPMNLLLPALALHLALPLPTSAQRFRGSPTQLSCKSTSLDKAGGEPGTRFDIELRAQCHVLVWSEAEERYFYFDTWTVDVAGSYDYATGRARERLARRGGTIREALVTCPQNPWAHAIFCDQGTKQIVANDDRTFVTGDIPATAHIVGAELRTSLAAWETSGGDDLDDWNPYPAKTAASVAIVRPVGLVPVEGGEVPLELEALTPLHETAIDLEWAKIVKSKDPSLGAESWYEGYPKNAPTEVDWSALPTTIPMAGVFEVGTYAVRAKMRGDPESSWSDWKRFVVAGSEIRRELIRRAPALR